MIHFRPPRGVETTSKYVVNLGELTPHFSFNPPVYFNPPMLDTHGGGKYIIALNEIRRIDPPVYFNSPRLLSTPHFTFDPP